MNQPSAKVRKSLKKADLEQAANDYHALMDEASSAEDEGLYGHAISLALEAWEYIDGMMQFERKYSKRTFASISAIDLILDHAPFLFDFPSLDRLEQLLKSCRRIERNTSDNLADRLADARVLMWKAHRLWNHLEQHPNIRQDSLRKTLGGDQDKWRSITNAWNKMGLIFRTPEGRSYRITLATRMGAVVSGKCSSCGEVVEAPKAMFLEPLPCPNCGSENLFVIVGVKQPNL